MREIWRLRGIFWDEAVPPQNRWLAKAREWARMGCARPQRHRSAFLRRKALEITLTELKLIAAPAIIGLRTSPKRG